MNDKPKYDGYKVAADKFVPLFGQNHIRCILERFSELSKKALQNGTNINVMLDAPSGFGKTYFAEFYINLLWNVERHKVERWKPSKNEQETEFSRETKYVFIDEFHTLEKFTWLFPYLDRHDKVFILATNKLGFLDPAMLNGRAIRLTFGEYSDDELIQMAAHALNYPNLSIDCYNFIIKAAKRVPRRIVHEICAMMNSLEVDISTPKKFYEVMDYLGYNKKGLSPQERMYLKVLLNHHRPLSLQTIASCSGLDPTTIEKIIEPDLINQGIIEKTGKGRVLNDLQILAD